MRAVIEERGHDLQFLPATDFTTASRNHSAYAAWLGDTQEGDANSTVRLLAHYQVEWVVADHYAVDAEWEAAVSAHGERIMVIDDLADRKHHCDLLVDQTLGRSAAAYNHLVPTETRLLCGSEFAILRPQFEALREHSIRRRKGMSEVRQILVSLGGADAENITGTVLNMLASTELPDGCRIKVVLGWQSPWAEQIRRDAAKSNSAIEVLQGVEDMASLMAESDLAIGAAGSSTWERCCLGLPTIVIVLAENQRAIAKELAANGVSTVVAKEKLKTEFSTAIEFLACDRVAREIMSGRAASIVDGSGARRVVDAMELAHAH